MSKVYAIAVGVVIATSIICAHLLMRNDGIFQVRSHSDIHTCVYSERLVVPNITNISITNEKNNNALQKYVVLSAASPDWNIIVKDPRRLSYIFYLPMSALLWVKLNYQPVIVVVGKKIDWLLHPVLRIVKKECERAGASMIFIQAPSSVTVTMSQVVRLYVSGMSFFRNKSGYLLTSDADMWPFHKTFFNPPCTDCESKVIVYDYLCCSFLEKNKSIRQFPMSYIGMTLGTWREVMQFNETSIQSVDDIFDHLALNSIILEGTDGWRGSNLWFTDQNFVSKKIHVYLNTKLDSRFIGMIPHIRFHQRVNRARWPLRTPTNLDGLLDAHLLLKAYNLSVWRRIRPLLQLLASQREVDDADIYREKFAHNVGKITNEDYNIL